MTAATFPRGRARVPPWRDIRVLRVIGQLAVLAMVLLTGYVLWNNLTANMAAARLTFGFDFLRATAGFDISQTVIPYSPRDTYGHAFLAGLLNTLLVSVLGIVLATILGVIVGVARLSNNLLANRIAAGYVEIMRNTPLLVQLVLIYAVFLALPTVANSIALPGSLYLNQRGLIMPRPLAEPSAALWLALVVGGVVVAFAASRISSRLRETGRPTYALGRLGLVAMVLLPVIGWIVLQPFIFDVPVRERFNFVGGVAISPPFAALLLALVIYTAA